MGAWASSGGVVVGLDFESWEEGGETVFGYRSSRVGWGHYCEGAGEERKWVNAKDLDSFRILPQGRLNERPKVEADVRIFDV